jgi:acylphosphatase
LLDLLQSGNTPGSVDNVLVDWSEAVEPINGFAER